MKKSLVLLVGGFTVVANAQMGLLASGTQTVFRAAPPVVPIATQAVFTVQQPSFPAARPVAPAAPAQPSLSQAQAFSNLTQTTSSASAAQPVPPVAPAGGIPVITQPSLPTVEVTPPKVSTPSQPTLPTVELTQPKVSTPSVAQQPLPTVQTTVPTVSIPAQQQVPTLPQPTLNLPQTTTLPAETPQPALPAAWASTPVTQAVSVLNQAVSMLTQRVSAVSQSAVSFTQQTLPAVPQNSSIPQPALPAIPEFSPVAQPVQPAVQLQNMGSGTPSFQIANSGIRPPSPKFRQVEIPYYNVDESNIDELPVGLRFYEYKHIEGPGLESTWTNGVFCYENAGKYTQHLSLSQIGNMIVTNTIVEQVRVQVVSTNISQVGTATVVSEKISFLSEGIWVGDTLKYPTTATEADNKIVTSSLNGKTVRLSRKEDIILEIASTPSSPQGIFSLSNPRSANTIPALEALPRAIPNVPRMDIPDLQAPNAPQMAPSLPSTSDTNTLSLLEAQARGLDIRLREVTVIKWIWTTNNYNNLPRRTPIPHKMWVLGSEPVAEGFELF